VAVRLLARVTAWTAAAVLLLAVALTGCAGTVPAAFSPPAGAARLADVPFFPQLDYQCGPASLAGVLNYYGKRITPDEIARAIFREKIRGTVTLDMVLYAREQGLSARWSSATVGDIVQAVDERIPLIVMVDYGFSVVSQNHYMVVVGYDPKGIVANSGTTRETHIPWKDFLPTWERAKRWTLRIEPKESTKTGGLR
jgi:ABC-type bacteriocin/lantibiotic exporter with double-glycine peptidase domain